MGEGSWNRPRCTPQVDDHGAGTGHAGAAPPPLLHGVVMQHEDTGRCHGGRAGMAASFLLLKYDTVWSRAYEKIGFQRLS